MIMTPTKHRMNHIRMYKFLHEHLHSLVRSSGRPGARAVYLCLLSGALLSLAACGGSSQQAARSDGLVDNSGTGTPTNGGDTGNADPPETPEPGAIKKVVPVGTTGAVVALFPNGHAYYSPDGFNLGGTGATVPAYKQSQQVTDIEAAASGVVAVLADRSAYFSPDGQNLGGGGATVLAYIGRTQIASINHLGVGIDVDLTSGS